jgi:DNA helicase-2/ATP-dependent DNA helicase PcrA
MNTRSELEEERRLFYVAITRAEKQAYLTYTQSRYRWGKLIDAEPSRFIEEIDDKYVEKENVYPYKSKPLVDASIFESFKQKKEFNSVSKPNQSQLSKLKRLYNIQNPNIISNKTSVKLVIGMEVSHGRFGKGKVLSVEGSGNDKKAAINFQGFGVKNLLIRFAKLTILNSKEDI